MWLWRLKIPTLCKLETRRVCGIVLLQEGGPFPGPESGLLSNTQKWIVQGDTRADKAKDFIGKGSPGREQWGQGTQENCSAWWLEVSGFRVMGLVSGLSLASHLAVPTFGLIQGPSWRHTNLSAKMDSSAKVSGRLAGHIVGWRLLPRFRPLPNSSGWQ